MRKLTRLVKDRERRAAIRKFLAAYGHEMNKNRITIINDRLYYEGSIGGINFYKKWDKYFFRKRSSLTGKRFRKDPAFKGSRESAERFGAGNKLASSIYQLVEAEKREYRLFCFLKKRAIELLKEGRQLEEAREVLVDYLKSFGLVESQQQEQAQVLHEQQVTVQPIKNTLEKKTENTKYITVSLIGEAISELDYYRRVQVDGNG